MPVLTKISNISAYGYRAGGFFVDVNEPRDPPNSSSYVINTIGYKAHGSFFNGVTQLACYICNTSNEQDCSCCGETSGDCNFCDVSQADPYIVAGEDKYAKNSAMSSSYVRFSVGDAYVGGVRNCQPGECANTSSWISSADHRCSYYAITNSGSMYTWGYGESGQLGHRNINNYVSEKEVTGSAGGANGGWREVVATTYGAFAIRNSGSLWATGTNSNSRFGFGTLTSSVDQFTRIGTGSNWKMVAYGGGGLSAFAITDSGSLWACGDNGYGQLGLGDYTLRNVFTQVGTGSDWAWVHGGMGYTTFAIKTDGTLWSCGLNNQGTLGIGVPAVVSPYTQSFQKVGTSTKWREAKANGAWAYGIQTDNSLWQWGTNGQGLPLGTYLVPTQSVNLKQKIFKKLPDGLNIYQNAGPALITTEKNVIFLNGYTGITGSWYSGSQDVKEIVLPCAGLATNQWLLR